MHRIIVYTFFQRPVNWFFFWLSVSLFFTVPCVWVLCNLLAVFRWRSSLPARIVYFPDWTAYENVFSRLNFNYTGFCCLQCPMRDTLYGFTQLLLIKRSLSIDDTLTTHETVILPSQVDSALSRSRGHYQCWKQYDFPRAVSLSINALYIRNYIIVFISLKNLKRSWSCDNVPGIITLLYSPVILTHMAMF